MGVLLKRTVAAVAIVGVLITLRYVVAGRGTQSPGMVRVERPLMGMVWKLEVLDHGEPEKARRVIDSAFAEVARIDRLMSEYKPESPVSAINDSAGKAAVAVPTELVEMLKRGKRYSEISGGAFDLTWRGMGPIWRLGDGFVPPTEAAVKAALRNVNHRELEIEGDRVRLARAGMSLGLGGIAAGYAVDRAARILTEGGFPDSLVDSSGDILVSGNRGDRGWRLGVQHPRKERGQLLGVVELSGGKALATSGDYERFRMVGGIRYHHIIDTRTGWPANQCQSVTVIAPSTEQADALSTTIFVLGPERGLELARAEGVDVLLVDSQGKQWMTEGFRQLYMHAGDPTGDR